MAAWVAEVVAVDGARIWMAEEEEVEDEQEVCCWRNLVTEEPEEVA